MSEESDINAAITKDTPSDNQTAEEYAYLDRGGFSSEKFKIELRGLPKFYGIAVRMLIFIYLESCFQYLDLTCWRTNITLYHF